ncbi:MAG: bifunctional UDP-N-acetylglucosamine diphosphorylase/glucosamine-1-phosphate N-acetyltransferase GlmU [Firmicutes bacterium]|jgi:bifunctional UDP-N-acetylglucosamine pyrophosphorylase/glucosamine-1-phosphate N-acetyltransferase|nr:bifunctional UDP-N-acetylglucosamine diphosphorylase/glucosamine-1-phosphate N-acetyltransferase GlmU [Bacillota bacterium]
MGPFIGLILAAGLGKRMRSALPKVLHEVAGVPMVDHVFRTVRDAGAKKVLVLVGHGGERIEEHFRANVEIVWQKEQLGTGHAVMCAADALSGYDGAVVVVPGDVPLLQASSIRHLVEQHEKSGSAATMLTMVLSDPAAYGRVVRDGAGRVTGVVEFKDASDEIRTVREVNTGVFCFSTRLLFEALPHVTNDNQQGEYYLPDVIPVLISRGHAVSALTLSDPLEGMGVNSRVELASAERVMRDRKRWEVMDSGVTLVDPGSTFIDMDVRIGRDTVILPFTIIQGSTSIGESCSVGPYVNIRDAVVGDGCKIGPFSFIRPGTVLADSVKVGDFVEVKNAKIATGSKVPHLTYVGDAIIGSGVNVGAGTITCNYDGYKKHTTVIEDGAFIGANSNLVAPVTVGREAYVATGSTVTTDVPPGSLAIARARQENKEGWVAKLKATRAAREENR